MAVMRRYGKQQQRKKDTLKSLNLWLNRPHKTGVARKVMSVVREGRALLDYMEACNFFVKPLRNGKLFHEPPPGSDILEVRSAKLRCFMSQLRFTLAMAGTDRMVPNALWLDIRPKTRDSGTWEHKRTLFFPIPSDPTDHATGDRNGWVALNVIMHIAPEGNFPQRCLAPLPKKAGVCSSWFVKITPHQHACSERCRQRKFEATSEYKKHKAEYARTHRERLKDLQHKWLEMVKREARRGKKR